VQVAQCPENQNWLYAVSSHNKQVHKTSDKQGEGLREEIFFVHAAFGI
jgi:hypothetical protein